MSHRGPFLETRKTPAEPLVPKPGFSGRLLFLVGPSDDIVRKAADEVSKTPDDSEKAADCNIEAVCNVYKARRLVASKPQENVHLKR